MSRLTSDFWVSAYIRAVERGGGFATLRRRGAREAGAIAIVVSGADRMSRLMLPAPQADFVQARPDDRRFVSAFAEGAVEPFRVEDKLAREIKFDPDLWVVDVDDREGRDFLDITST